MIFGMKEKMIILTHAMCWLLLQMKSSFANTDNSIYLFIFRNQFFLLRIPSNINQTAVGLFWLSNNN